MYFNCCVEKRVGEKGFPERLKLELKREGLTLRQEPSKEYVQGQGFW